MHDPPAPDLADPFAGVSARELLNALDEELQRLPERYRLAIVHCYLEGRTVDEAAARLATTPGAVRGWLAPARARLADGLAARGFSLPTALLALTAEAVTEVPAVAANAAQVPAVAVAAEAAVVSGVGRRLAWVAVACAGVAVGFAAADVILDPDGPPASAPVAGSESKSAPKVVRPEALPAGAVAPRERPLQTGHPADLRSILARQQATRRRRLARGRARVRRPHWSDRAPVPHTRTRRRFP